MRTVLVPMSRVEGDLEVRAEIEDGVVTRARCSGTMYRGFERLMIGRGPLDGLVITPRICGICTTGHLFAAASALDAISGATPPPDAVRLRNLALLTEQMQSDVRHACMMFAADYVNSAYAAIDLYGEAVRRYAPFAGTTVVEVVRETKRLLEIVALIGGQWPHSSFMIPGGIASLPSSSDLLQCRMVLGRFRAWYEQRILGCTVERFRDVKSAADLDAWLDAKPEHRDGEVGFYIRYARALGLERIGAGHGNFISLGSLPIPDGSAVRSPDGAGKLVPAGFLRHGALEPFDAARIAEHVAHSWFEDYEGGKHPFEGETKAYASGHEGGKYSWAKAPRYDGLPAETGPLAELLVAQNPLFVDLVTRGKVNAYVRHLARIVRPALVVEAAEAWLTETAGDGHCFTPTARIEEGDGAGLCHAARGALGHWVKIRDGKIASYQVITPTAWHASPRDSADVPGPIEQALVGTPVKDADNPIELGHVVRSFDPCLVCTVHTLDRTHRAGRLRLGFGA